MSNEESIRDKIDVDRTLQANKITLLEYLRMGLGLLVAGGLVDTARFRNMNQRMVLVPKQCGVDAKRKKD